MRIRSRPLLGVRVRGAPLWLFTEYGVALPSIIDVIIDVEVGDILHIVDGGMLLIQ